MQVLRVIANGLITGLIIQLAIGPIFFYIANLTWQRTIFDGLAGVAAVTLVDYLYILLAALGIGKLLERPKTKKIFGVMSSMALIIFGLLTIKNGLTGDASVTDDMGSSNLFSSFTSVFALAISSPLVIAFNMSLFAAKAADNHYSTKEIFLFGYGIGLATLLFMGSSVIVLWLIGGFIPNFVMQILNALVGILLIGYGGTRLISYALHQPLKRGTKTP